MIAAALLSSACVVVPERYVGGTVAIAPPAARVEEVGVAPGVGYVWIGGYWGWAGRPPRVGPGLLGASAPGLRLGTAPLGSGQRRLAAPPRVLASAVRPAGLEFSR